MFAGGCGGGSDGTGSATGDGAGGMLVALKEDHGLAFKETWIADVNVRCQNAESNVCCEKTCYCSEGLK